MGTRIFNHLKVLLVSDVPNLRQSSKKKKFKKKLKNKKKTYKDKRKPMLFEIKQPNDTPS
jgi:hypothetical protein